MTPWNLVGMAKVKGLDVIALTDHNTARNTPQAVAAGREYGVAVIPGVEVTAKEEVHILAYFDELERALAFGDALYAHLPEVQNKPGLFGNQIIVGENDEPCGTLDKLLITATDLTLNEVCALTAQYGGVNVPAHINRGSNSMIGTLGLMPMLPEYPVVEVYSRLNCPAYAVKGRTVLHSSDAHRLEDIQEQVFSLEVAQPTARGVLDAIRAAMQR